MEDEKKTFWQSTKDTCRKVWPYVKIGAICLVGGCAYGYINGYSRGRKDECTDIGDNIYITNIDKQQAIEDRISNNIYDRLENSYDKHIDDIVKGYVNDLK